MSREQIISFGLIIFLAAVAFCGGFASGCNFARQAKPDHIHQFTTWSKPDGYSIQWQTRICTNCGWGDLRHLD